MKELSEMLSSMYTSTVHKSLCTVLYTSLYVQYCTQVLYTGLCVQYPVFLSDFKETQIFSTEFRKMINIKFHENLFGGRRVVTCGRTDTATDITKLIATFGHFVNELEKLQPRCPNYSSTGKIRRLYF